MAQIKIKRGPSSNITSLTLLEGELAYTTDSKKLYVGNSDGTKTMINKDLAASDIPNITLSKITDAGTAAGKNTGTTSGTVPLLDSNGKLPSSVIPASHLTETFVVATQAAMLALSQAGVGDVAVRTDLSNSFILQATPASTLANWVQLLSPASPVQSVNGQTGAVVLAKGDVGLDAVDNTADSAKSVSKAATLTTARTIAISGGATGTATSFNGSANITIAVTALDASKANAGTLAVARGGTGAATLTGLVKGNGTGAFTAAVAGTDYIDPNGVIDGGTF